MSFSELISDIKAIRRGKATAALDIARVEHFEAQHQTLHAADSEYNCHPASKAFYMSLSQPESFDDPIERAAYLRVITAWYADYAIANAGKGDSPFPNIEGVKFIPLEFTGNESQEEMIEKARRAFADADAFNDVISFENSDENAPEPGEVSETDQPSNPTDTKPEEQK